MREGGGGDRHGGLRFEDGSALGEYRSQGGRRPLRRPQQHAHLRDGRFRRQPDLRITGRRVGLPEGHPPPWRRALEGHGHHELARRISRAAQSEPYEGSSHGTHHFVGLSSFHTLQYKTCGFSTSFLSSVRKHSLYIRRALIVLPES